MALCLCHGACFMARQTVLGPAVTMAPLQMCRPCSVARPQVQLLPFERAQCQGLGANLVLPAAACRLESDALCSFDQSPDIYAVCYTGALVLRHSSEMGLPPSVAAQALHLAHCPALHSTTGEDLLSEEGVQHDTLDLTAFSEEARQKIPVLVPIIVICKHVLKELQLEQACCSTLRMPSHRAAVLHAVLPES
jgi:hypothetical protein